MRFVPGQGSDGGEDCHAQQPRPRHDEAHVLHSVLHNMDQSDTSMVTRSPPITGHLSRPAPLVHGQLGGEGLQHDVVEEGGEVAPGQHQQRNLWGLQGRVGHSVVVVVRLLLAVIFLAAVLQLGVSPDVGVGALLELSVRDEVLTEDAGEEDDEADHARGCCDPAATWAGWRHNAVTFVYSYSRDCAFLLHWRRLGNTANVTLWPYFCKLSCLNLAI